MFSAWGRFVYRFRRPIAVLSIVFAVAASILASGVTGALSAGGWTDPDSESAAVTQRLSQDFDAAGSTIVAVYRGQAGDDARSPEFQATIADSMRRLVADDRVEGAIGWAETQDATHLPSGCRATVSRRMARRSAGRASFHSRSPTAAAKIGAESWTNGKRL